MMLLLGLTALAATVYLLIGIAVAHRIAGAAPTPVVRDADLPTLSVIVPARDEEAALPACLDALARQDYPKDRLEVLVADDHSSDRTAEIAREWASRERRFHVVDVAASGHRHLYGKARAVHAAIERGDGEVVLFTDGDCRPPASWCRGLASFFAADAGAGVVSGITVVRPVGWLGAVQQLDWLLLLGTSSAASLAGRPLTAMGNNMGVRRSAYDAVGGYPAVPASVTEDYALFRAVERGTRFRALLLPNASARNETEPVGTLREAFAQRRRWARGGLHAPFWVYLFYAMVISTHALLAAAIALDTTAAVAGLGAKVVADVTVIHATARRLQMPVPWRVLPIYEVLLFSYVLLLPVTLAVAPRIRWKERVH